MPPPASAFPNGSHLLPAADNRNRPIVEPGRDGLDLCHFNLLRLRAGEATEVAAPGCEILCVVLSGRADIDVGPARFTDVGRRESLWSGPADSVYCGTSGAITLRATVDGTEVAVAGGRCHQAFAPFRIPPEETRAVEVGSLETQSHRRIVHLLGQNGEGRAGTLWVSELYASPGCWSGYPPHKHDTERLPDESDFEELYHYRFRPETGFGAQFCYDRPDAGDPPAGRVVMTRHGDTFLVRRGFHPTVTSPGHEGYIFTVLVGRHQRSLVQWFEPIHHPLMSRIPGIQAMRDRFR
jgi:5-deoxy-glucuronate isomerase